MKRHTIFQLMVGLLILATFSGTRAASGQPETRPSNYEHLKPMEPFIGRWVAETVTEEEIPGLATSGAAMVIPVTYEWTLNRNFIAVNYSVNVGDVTLLGYQGLIGWDPATQQIKSWGFDSDGGHGQAVWIRSDGRWTATVNGVQRDGKKVLATMTRVDTSSDSFTVQFSDQAVGGQPQSDGPELIFRREVSAGGNATAEEVQINVPAHPGASTDQEGGAQDDLDRVQGTWERWEGMVFRKRRITKEIRGNSEKVTYYNRDDTVQSAHTVEFELKRGPGPTRIFQYRNMTYVEGPNQGEQNVGEFSYVYKVSDDAFVETWGLLVGDETQPIHTLRWKRVAH